MIMEEKIEMPMWLFQRMMGFIEAHSVETANNYMDGFNEWKKKQ